ncbi:MAG: asparagine synthase (glutamine-hydrolyzing) [Flavobacteriaceae bacterium]|nr:asparagine synthase (glutamine-hydrolyzing) [Bacteroidia bacterium]NNK88859.1 asparagine synthase (glutamine-hydrolyzing) [Flavobacteriaceae bacterium]
MCGIYGTTLKYSKEQVQKKLERTNFRGPDYSASETVHFAGNPVTLGHNRLSIIDLDPRSNQPFNYQDRIHLVYNGEIYNFKDLRKDLSQKGFTFHTTSDTEVVCAAYLAYGRDCVDHFNGMFAFALLDLQEGLIFGARDRTGQKPFYYYQQGKDFEFASQLSSIQLYNSNLSISQEAIQHYLCWNTIPDPFSIFNEIKKLKAGHKFVFNLDTGKMLIEKYWDIDQKGLSLFEGSFEEATQSLHDILVDAVKIRLFADVPVGVFLSGGIDSSLISALAVEASSKKVKTFSVKFNEEEYDESIYAEQVARHLGTDHHVISCNYNEGMDLIESFSHYYDEPFADSSAIPSMLLSKHTRQQVTVALTGDGGDESFIGYPRYKWLRKGSMIFRVPHPIRSLGSKFLSLSPNYRHTVIGRALKLKNANTAYISSMTSVDRSYLKGNFDPHDIQEAEYLFHKDKNILERASDFDIKTYLNWDINTKVDRASMAFSLETRAPLLDYRVIDFAESLPTKFKFDSGDQKVILKQLLYSYLPKQIFEREKAGFAMPFADWFRNDLKDYVMSELNDKSLNELPCINPDRVKFMIDQHMNYRWNRYPLIWKLLVLKQWLSRNGSGYSIK